MGRPKLTTEQFIKRARKVHGDEYDYSESIYQGAARSIRIRCRCHGEFNQKAAKHVEGAGCPECGREKNAASKRYTLAQFVAKAKTRHGDKYDYLDTVYHGSDKTVSVSCPAHGPFFIRASHHTAGQGCPVCGEQVRRQKLRQTQEDLIKKFRAVHGDRYGYDQVEHVNSQTPVKILCVAHGYFLQRPWAHIKGSGCPRCATDSRSLGQDTFVERARSVHKDKYDYSSSVYLGRHEKLDVRCPSHGNFSQEAGSHLDGAGCPQCALEARFLTTDEFAQRAAKVHAGKYDYRKTKYVRNDVPVIVTCTQHGDFSVVATQHLNGPTGCPACAKEKAAAPRPNNRTTKKQFLAKAQTRHGAKYNYDLVNYKDTKTKVEILCSEHGPFWQTPLNHTNGNGCPACGRNRVNAATRARPLTTFKKFKAKARKKHSNKYKYLEFSGLQKPAVVECPRHGQFTQKAAAHIRGQGCRKCRDELYSKTFRKTTEEFVAVAKAVHGSLFNYDKVNYTTHDVPVLIGCRRHGHFKQRPGHHLEGHGCPTCSSSQGERAVRRWLDEHGINYFYQWREHGCIAMQTTAVFDFWIPEHEVIIEYDGKQHFRPLRKIGGHYQTPEEAAALLARIQQSDANKNAWAQDNNIQMIRIRYDEDVAEKLDHEFEMLNHNTTRSQEFWDWELDEDPVV